MDRKTPNKYRFDVGFTVFLEYVLPKKARVVFLGIGGFFATLVSFIISEPTHFAVCPKNNTAEPNLRPLHSSLYELDTIAPVEEDNWVQRHRYLIVIHHFFLLPFVFY